MEQYQWWRQYIVAGVANVMVACVGYITGWTAPIAPKLRSPATSPLVSVPTGEDIAWLGSLLAIGAIFGPFIGGPAASRLGRKWGLMSACIPMVLGWVLVAVAADMTYLYAARVSWGVAGGMTYTIVPMYCAEIATAMEMLKGYRKLYQTFNKDDVRGALCSMIQVFITIGYLLVYSIGAYITYWGIAYVGIASVGAFVVIFLFMPETPTYYLLNDKREAAATCLCTLRGLSRSGVEDELNKIEVNIKNSTKNSAAVLDIFHRRNFKALYIACALMLFQQFSGVSAMVFYMTDIFKDSGIDLDPGIATITIGAVQVIASSITPLVVDRLGRRLLLMVSSCGSAVALIMLGMFFLLVENGSEVVTNISFLPVLSLVLFMLAYCCGLGPLPWTIMGELFSVEVKAIASLITTVFSCSTAFLVSRFFEPTAIALGRYAAFWLFAGFCVISFFFTMLLVPETKGKSFQEIQDMLASRKTSKTKKASSNKPAFLI